MSKELKYFLRKSSWSKGESSYVTFKMDQKASSTYRHRLLDCVCKSQSWGKINQRRTVFNEDGITLKWYSCSGHGGYVLFTRQEIPMYGCKPEMSAFDWGVSSDWYVYVFEEDEAWASLIHILPKDKLEIFLNKESKYIKGISRDDLKGSMLTICSRYHKNMGEHNRLTRS